MAFGHTGSRSGATQAMKNRCCPFQKAHEKAAVVGLLEGRGHAQSPLERSLPFSE